MWSNMAFHFHFVKESDFTKKHLSEKCFPKIPDGPNW
jgi:hypothetical protein